jgi:hypothetical protein
MAQEEEEILEDYLDIFLYNLQKSKHVSLNYDIIHTIISKGIQDEFIDVLNLQLNSRYILC